MEAKMRESCRLVEIYPAGRFAALPFMLEACGQHSWDI
jgi:hypothetical protein